MTDACCVNWGTKYGVDYTIRLYNMVKRNTSYDFKFYCLTDNPTLYDTYPHINAVEIDTDDTTWWTKLLLFNKGTLPEGEYVYFDLDVVIVDNIDCVFDHPSFGITRDFIRPDDGILPGKEFNSSIVRFNNTRTQGIYDYYINSKKSWLDYQKVVHFFGDQNLISSYINHYPDFCTPFPDEWFWSFKKGVKRGKTAGDRSQWFGRNIPKGGKICVFHGDPSPMDVISNPQTFISKGKNFCTEKTVEWIKNNWK